MRLACVAVVIALLAASSLSASSSYVVPTTTLAVQTANNTSAANSFTKQTNNNKGAGNVSKVDIHTLFYAGASTKVYAHMVLWFGQSSHMNIGYSETNAAQVQSQIDDMVSRGIDGVIIDWYGPGNAIDRATQLVMAAAEGHPGFTFAIMIDQGAIEWYSCPGCSPQQALVSELQYIEKTYFPSPAYMTQNGQPVVTNFNVSLSYPSVNWQAANASLNTHPVYIFQNNDGFTPPLSDGSYSWVMPTTNDYGMGYLNSFYDAGMAYPNEQTVGASYKGFNDTLASWGSNRIMQQQCGQTWLQTFSKLNGMYNSGKQLSALQLVTWNDYEEATEIESGIDNCLTISSSVTGSSLQWSINGQENTLDHYTVYISADGQNLMPLTDIATGIQTLDLCSFSIPDGAYTMFVQAVGKPSIANQMSGATSFTSTCVAATPPPPPPPPAATVTLSAAPATVTIAPGAKGTFTVVATPQSGSFNSTITLSCASISANLSCAFTPATITPGTSAGTATLTVSTSTVTGTNVPRHGMAFPIYATWLLPFGFVSFAFAGKRARKGASQVLALCAVISVGMMGASCGGFSTSSHSATPTVSVAAPTSYAITIDGVSTASKVSTTVNLIVQ